MYVNNKILKKCVNNDISIRGMSEYYRKWYEIEIITLYVLGPSISIF